MRLLLDTHIFMWASGPQTKVPPRIGSALSDVRNGVFVSAATAWEIAIKVAQGRLDFPIEDFFKMVDALRGTVLQMTAAHALEAGALPPIHADPFDRMLIAQARTESLTLVTVDRTIPRYGIDVLTGS